MGICVCPLCGQSFFTNNFYLKGELPLNTLLLLCAVILVACIIGSKISSRIGVPTLLIFIALGMLFGSDGILKIEFEDYAMAEKVCSAALIIIMFYGGFGTNWSMARPTAVKSVLLSTLGVILTAGLTGLFCHFVLKTDLLTGLLIGSVLGSTDAASVFSILRSKRLNLKYGTASMLEIESGSNDPCAYMLTIIVLSAMSGQLSAGGILYSIFAQIAYGIGAGVLFALLGGWVLRRIHLGEEGFQSIFLVALALASYALPSLLGGNGYLSTYITGIILGNQEIHRKRELVNFFDAFNSMMQMVIFFLLGLLVFPSQLPEFFLPALATALFLTLIARPAAVALLLTPFPAPLHQQLLVSWAGLRGAASIVFSIMAAVSPSYGDDYVFHIVFCVVLLSLLCQGTLLPLFSRKLDMIDNRENVLKTFNNYSEETSIRFIRLEIGANHPWVNQNLREIATIPGTLIAAVLRGDENKAVIPKGDTVLREGDSVIIGAKEYQDQDGIELTEKEIEPGNRLIGKPLKAADLPKDSLVVLIRRDHGEVIPDGGTVIRQGDVLVIYSAG